MRLQGRDLPPERDLRDAIRLYQEMWSIGRVASLFGTDHATMRRLIARHAALRAQDRRSPRQPSYPEDE